tara:strand:- start:248 stop:847 length:600 start_codon:yes stop_codon:yes gene_type:complete
MADALQESLKIASRKKQQWMKRMKEAGYILVGENAFKRKKDKTSPSGYRDTLVTSYGKDFRNKFQGMNLPASAGYQNKSGDFEQAKAENPGVQPRTWTETPLYDQVNKLVIPKKTKQNELKIPNNEKVSKEIKAEETKVEEPKVTPKVSATKEPWTGEVGKRKLTNATSIQKKLRKAGFKDEELVKLMIQHRDWKAARR